VKEISIRAERIEISSLNRSKKILARARSSHKYSKKKKKKKKKKSYRTREILARDRSISGPQSVRALVAHILPPGYYCHHVCLALTLRETVRACFGGSISLTRSVLRVRPTVTTYSDYRRLSPARARNVGFPFLFLFFFLPIPFFISSFPPPPPREIIGTVKSSR